MSKNPREKDEAMSAGATGFRRFVPDAYTKTKRM
jgi:hypothetical protein